MKKKSVVLSMVFALIISSDLLLSGCKSDRPPSGIFSWNPEKISEEAREELTDTLETLSITEIYQLFTDENLADGSAVAFVNDMNELGISVHYLTGNPQWYLEDDNSSLKAEIDKAADLSAACKKPLLDIMVDVEPYLTDLWDEDQTAAMDKYVNSMISAHSYAAEKNLKITACIPSWFDNQHKESLEILIKSGCDAIAVMNYHKADESKNIATEAALASKYSKPIINISEFQRPGTHDLAEINTYYNDGVEAALDSWKVIYERLNYDKLYFAYHYYDCMLEIISRDS